MQDTALSAKIAKLNDASRRNVLSYMTSAGVISLPPEVVSEIYTRVYNFKKFTEDNDPYGEHDFGSLKVARQRVFWKIDYYDEKDDDEKRQILIELFENIMFKNDAVSVNLKDRAELIAKYSSKTRELLGTQKSNDRTFTNSENNRGQNNEKSAENALYPLWQGHMESNHNLRFWRPLY